MSAELWPYAVVLLAGFLPNEVFRIAAVVAARGIDPRSPWLEWVKIVAITLLAAVVSRLLYAPPSVLAAVPFPWRIAAVALGVAVFYAARRSVVVGLLAGEALLAGTAWWLARG